MPGGVNSPVRSFKHVGGAPVYFDRGEGAELVDVDGKRYVDFCLAFGPLILGHSHPAVVRAIQEQAQKGTTYGACHPGEVDLAGLLLQGFPFLERARLVNSGTEAVMTAVRLARGFTGRDKVVVFEGCYHGHSDGLMAKAGSGLAELADATSKGVPKSVVADTIVLPFGDIDALEKTFAQYPEQIAAVLLEPVPANYGLLVPERELLQKLMSMTASHKALVIFDEVITGFRLSLAGASGYFDLKPDLVTLGKIIGGGLPLAAVLGRKEIMETLAPCGPVYQAGTLSGNALAAAAGKAALQMLWSLNPYELLASRTQKLLEGLKPALEKRGPFLVRSVGSLFWICFQEQVSEFPPKMAEKALSEYRAFFKDALQRGVYLPPSPYEVGFLSVAHTDGVLDSVLNRLND